MENLKDMLLDLEKKNSLRVKSKLKKGDLIEKFKGLYYEIDDLGLHKNLPEYKEGALPYGQIHKKLKSDGNQIYNFFNEKGVMRDGKKVVPFSQIINAGLGECLEKAILSHMATQDVMESFLISGALSKEGGSVEEHAYNIVFLNDKPHIIDIQNPIIDSQGKISQPYVAEVHGFNNKLSRFVQHPEWEKLGRFYEIE